MKSKERRHVEILSLAQEHERTYSITDLCDLFRVEVATIQRDLHELRALGFPIHSVRNAVRLLRPLTEADTRLLLARFVAYAGESIGFPKSTVPVVKKLKTQALRVFVSLVNAIEQGRALNITYRRLYDHAVVTYDVEPYELFPTSRDWRLVARSDGIFKQFLVENILSISEQQKKFVREKGFKLEELFKHSFEYWTSGEIFDVVLKFHKSVADAVAQRVWSEEQELEYDKGGSLILKLKVNSLEEIGNWVMTWGGKATVIHPKELKEYVTANAREILRVYDSRV